MDKKNMMIEKEREIRIIATELAYDDWLKDGCGMSSAFNPWQEVGVGHIQQATEIYDKRHSLTNVGADR